MKGKLDPRLCAGRREALRALGAASLVALAEGCGAGDSTSEVGTPSSPSAVGTADTGPCVVRPQQTEGPYFVDERLNRSDIRSDPTDGSVREGVVLRVRLNVSRMEGTSCTPLPGALVDLWQCDALGVYSDVRDMAGRFDTRGRKFLRGHQLTDANGAVEFLTIHPGWYPGRTVHVHFKVRTDPTAGRGQEFTSQLYFDESITDRVHAQPPYNRNGRRTTTNAGDGIYRNGGDRLMLPVVADGQGYAGVLPLALQV